MYYNIAMLWIIAIIGVTLGIVYIFASPQLSPIPFYRSNPKDLNLILKLLRLRNNQVVLDLGAGDGLIILKAAQYCFEKKLDTEFVAVETNPILILLIWTKLLFQPNRKRIYIVMKSLFEINYSELINHGVR
jgi:tRNA1(Val) A37 N6-methylase TrmN6